MVEHPQCVTVGTKRQTLTLLWSAVALTRMGRNGAGLVERTKQTAPETIT
ncbi:hypothetical protein [Streptomyces violarus]|nr:hypothetical protein [Streptomyces violarus]MCT9137641.1 hypothetical protein [Streptomyces violarus]